MKTFVEETKREIKNLEELKVPEKKIEEFLALRASSLLGESFSKEETPKDSSDILGLFKDDSEVLGNKLSNEKERFKDITSHLAERLGASFAFMMFGDKTGIFNYSSLHASLVHEYGAKRILSEVYNKPEMEVEARNELRSKMLPLVMLNPLLRKIHPNKDIILEKLNDELKMAIGEKEFKSIDYKLPYKLIIE